MVAKIVVMTLRSSSGNLFEEDDNDELDVVDSHAIDSPFPS